MKKIQEKNQLCAKPKLDLNIVISANRAINVVFNLVSNGFDSKVLSRYFR